MIPDRSDGPPVQTRLAVGPKGWTLGGGEYDQDGLVEHVVTDDGTGDERRWKVRVPLRVDASGDLVAGAAEVEEVR